MVYNKKMIKTSKFLKIMIKNFIIQVNIKLEYSNSKVKKHRGIKKWGGVRLNIPKLSIDKSLIR